MLAAQNNFKDKLRKVLSHRVTKNALALYSIQAVNNVLPWITFPYLTRTLQPEKWGLIGWSQEFIRYFLVITSFGFDFTATRQISIHRDNADAVSRIFSAVMIAKTLLMLASFLVMLTIVEITPSMRPHLALFLITWMTVIANVIFPQWLFQGVEKMGVVTVRETAARLIGLLPTFLLVHGPNDYLIAASIQSGSGAIAAVVGLSMVGRYTTARFRLVSWREVLDQYRDGSHVFLSMVAINLYGSSNRFILRFLSGDRGVALILVAQRIIEAAKALVIALSEACFPYISHTAATSRSEAMRLFRRAEQILAIPFGVLSLGLFLFAPLGIGLAAGNRYAMAVPLLRIMSPQPLFLAFGTLYATQFMLGLGYKREWMKIIVEGALLNFVMLGGLLPFIAAPQAVAVTSTAVDSWILLRSWLFYRKHRDDHSFSTSVPG
jgi:PST family polysaccharide transporter